jgi:ABC-type glycerol-3-phosphate transport system permease component
MIISSFKPELEVSAYPATWLPHVPTLINYFRMFRQTSLLTNFLNSTVVTLTVTGVVVIASLFSGYAFSRIRFRGRNLLFILTLAGYLLPWVICLLPIYYFMNRINLIDNLMSIFVVYIALTLPFGIWIMTGYLENIPREIEEAALIDGCGIPRTVISIILPVAKPGIVATALLSVMICWQEFFFAFILLHQAKNLTIPPAIMKVFIFQNLMNWGGMMAACLVAILPIIAFFVIFQKQIISGLTTGSVKG